MKCCKCSCSLAKCIEEQKTALIKEFNEMITNWMKNYPEVKSVWVREKSCGMSNYIVIHPNKELKVDVYFE